jgi:N utilization substance protein B
MLSRRFLRIKVLQALYAYLQDGPDSLNAGEKQLLVSLDKLYELYIHQFSFILEVVEFASRRIEEGKLKYLPTPEDLNPNTRFINNRFIAQLNNNRDLKKKIDSYRINWADETEMIRKCYNLIRELPDYVSYMGKKETEYSDDKQIIEDVFLKLIAEMELLRSYFEEKNLYWSDDFDISLIMIMKTIKGFRESMDEFTPLPDLLKDQHDKGGSDDLKFVKELYRKVIIRDKELNPVIAAHADNWEYDRIALMDTILIKMALTELMDFPFIPVKVTMNEYIELSKSFSTPKSKVFVNGILDKIVAEFRDKGKIKKTGRGLLE